MCVNPKLVYSRTTKVDNFTPILVTCSCGICSECRLNKIDQYLVRCSAELTNLIKKRQGLCYFDTLTYDPKHLPVDFGISHFRNSDVQRFIRNLRRYLSEYYGEHIKFSYIITPEYGTDDNATHRPHYHCLFYVDSNLVSAAKFHQLLRKAWNQGNTDLTHNVDYRLGVVWTSEFIRGYVARPSKWALSYVCKYCAKDGSLEKKLSTLSDEQKKLIDFYEIKPRIIISTNFGKSLLQHEHSLIDKGYYAYREPGETKPREIPIPGYYYRKIFYDATKEIQPDGKKKVIWTPKREKLADFQSKHLEKKIQRRISQLRTLFGPESVGNFTTTYDKKSVLLRVAELLDGRSLRKYVEYELIYKNRFYKESEISLDTQINAIAPLFTESRFTCDLYGDNASIARAAIRNYLINENSFWFFRYFDQLHGIIHEIETNFKTKRDNYNQRIYEEKKKLKQLYEIPRTKLY